MTVKQKHIAEALGLSLITVSRALRGHPDLAEETKKRVILKAKEMGYSNSRSRRAATLETSPGRIGLLFYGDSPGVASGNPLESGVRRSIFHAVQAESQRRELEIIIECPQHDQTPMLVKNKTIRAVLLFGSYPQDLSKHLQNIPTLAVSRYVGGSGLSHIVADNYNGMRQATQHLIDLGHRDIQMISRRMPGASLYAQREEGYSIAMMGAGLQPRISRCEDAHDIPPIEELRGLRAIVCGSDSLAYQVQSRLLQAGVRVPEDCSIVGFDNLRPEYSTLVTSYAPDWEKMGRLATKLVLDESTAITTEEVTITVPGNLIVRHSTRPVSASG